MPKRSATALDAKNAKVPKAVQAARDKIVGDITGESLKQQLDAKTYNALTSAFRSSLAPHHQDTYKKMSSDIERRDFLAAFVMDPAEFKAKGTNSVSATNDTIDEEQGEWLMQAQIAGPAFLNSESLAKTLCESGELPSRPNEFECFRKKDIPQFWFTRSMLRKLTGVSEKAEVHMEASVTKSEYDEVADSMRTGLCNAKALPKKKAPCKKPKEPESLEARALREAVASKKASTVKLHRAFTSLRNDSNNALMMIPSIEKRGFPPEFCYHLQGQVEAAVKLAEDAARFYAAEIIKPEHKDPASVDNVTAEQQAIEEHILTVEQTLAKCKKGVFADIKRNSAAPNP